MSQQISTSVHRSQTCNCKLVDGGDVQLICNCGFSSFDTHTHTHTHARTGRKIYIYTKMLFPKVSPNFVLYALEM